MKQGLIVEYEAKVIPIRYYLELNALSSEHLEELMCSCKGVSRNLELNQNHPNDSI